MTLCKCYILGLGKNNNRSNITKSAAENALPSLYNIPVLGHLYADKDGNLHMGGHDLALIKTEEGEYKFKSLTTAYGTVPFQEETSFEDVKEKDGSTRSYQVADIILWTGKFPELFKAIYDKDVWFNHSVEICVNETKKNKEDKTITDITSFNYEALCLLGKSDNKKYDVAPCFPSSQVKPYEFALDGELKSSMTEFNEELKRYFELQKGGEEKMDNVEDVKSENVLKSAEYVAVIAPAVEPEEGGAIKEPFCQKESLPEGNIEAFIAWADVSCAAESFAPDTYSLTYETKRTALTSALKKFSKSDKSGWLDYWLEDFDDKYIYVDRQLFQNEGREKAKGRIPYEMKADESVAILEEFFEKMVVRWLTLEEAAELESVRAEIEALKTFKQERLEADKKEGYGKIAVEFSDLADDENYQNLISGITKFDSEESLREALFALRGKKYVFSAGNPKRRETIAPIMEPEKGTNNYKMFFEKYLRKN
jgi:hypothetical protein